MKKGAALKPRCGVSASQGIEVKSVRSCRHGAMRTLWEGSVPKGRILAVDDQRYFRELIEEMLVEGGFEVQSAASGEDALRLLQESSYDIILTDLVMPAMDGSELVRRIKDQDPDQAVVVVTGVVDVKTAVDAMKLGADDYLIKPFDNATLANSLEGILEQKRLRAEHEKLLAENIEYLGERSLYERAISLFSTMSLLPLADRLVEALCLETQAQGGVIWIADQSEKGRLTLASARGLVRVEAEPEFLKQEDIPEEFRPSGKRTLLKPWGTALGARRALFLAARRDMEIIALVRLSDRLGGGEFDTVDSGCAEKLLRFGEVAIANAIRIRGLERRSLQDPTTGAYVIEYFEDLTHKEIENANRSGRNFSLLKVDLGPLTDLCAQIGEAEVLGWLGRVVSTLRDVTRTSDVIASDGGGAFFVLLADSDRLGAAVLRRRVRESLSEGGALREGPSSATTYPTPRVGVATYPADGLQREALMQVLDERVEEERQSPVDALGLSRLSLTACLERLLEESECELPETAEQIVSFVLAELARQPRDRGLLYIAPGSAFDTVVHQGLAQLAEIPHETEISIVHMGDRPPALDPRVIWLKPAEGKCYPPLLIRFGDGPAYALVREEKAGPDGARMYHSTDRCLIEHLMFLLQAELGTLARAGLQ